ncbi:MAG: DUF4386 domain-containing protein [Dehalococcoidia bacterium]
MNTSNPAATATSPGAQAAATRKIALIAGIFFLLTFVHVAILPLYGDVLTNPDFILGAGDATPVRLGAFIEVITAIANVATGVILFQVLRRQQLAIALGYVAVRVFESTIILVGTVSLLSIVTLREGFAGGAGAEAADLSAIGSSLVAIRDWTFFFGPGICAGFGNGLLLGYLMYRSGLVPRKLALLGLIGGPLSLVGLSFVLFGQWEQDAPIQFLFTFGEIAWELSLSIYLIVKGFRPSPITAEVRRDVGQERISATPSVSSAAL